MVNFGGQHDTSVLQKLNAYVMVPDQLDDVLTWKTSTKNELPHDHHDLL